MRCKSLGQLMTAPRRAILGTLLPRQMQRFLRELEKLGLAEMPSTSAAPFAVTAAADPTSQLLQELAGRLAYRLA